ncbi:MAG: hypothetical protein J4451_02000 [DPANN group archaeon]|nr:hypothetical protein [DPANN group archaeon]
MATDLRINLLASELAMFLTVQVLALFVGFQFIATKQVNQPQLPATIAEGAVQLLPLLVAIAIATIILILFLKYFKSPASAKLFLALILFVGINIVFDAFFPSLIALILTIFVLSARFLKPNVFTHNLVFFLALAGVGARLGTLIRVELVIGLLIILSIYDYIAVFKTKHMVSMFKDMLQKGIPMGIVIPEHPSHMSRDISEVSTSKLKEKTKKSFMMLGGGDLAFPALFAVSALAQYGLTQALGVVFGSLAGIVIIHWLIVSKKFRALPALPPLAATAILGFLISLLF